MMNWFSLDTSSVVSNYVSAVAIVIGGVWVIWKWGFSEWLRRRKEIPSVEGSLETEATPIAEEKIAVTLNARWINKSGLPVYIDHSLTRVDVYSVNTEICLGNLVPKHDLGDPIIRARPYEDMDGFILEPNTNNLLQTHYVLEPKKTYLFRWKLYRNKRRHGGKVFAWTKEQIFQYRKCDDSFS